MLLEVLVFSLNGGFVRIADKASVTLFVLNLLFLVS